MARDPIAILQRLRALEVLAARRALADSIAAETGAIRQATDAARAILEEGREASGADFAAWLPRGLAARDAAARVAAQAATRRSQDEQAVARSRAAARSVELVAETRARDAARDAARKAQAALDEAARQAPTDTAGRRRGHRA